MLQISSLIPFRIPLWVSFSVILTQPRPLCKAKARCAALSRPAAHYILYFSVCLHNFYIFLCSVERTDLLKVVFHIFNRVFHRLGEVFPGKCPWEIGIMSTYVITGRITAIRAVFCEFLLNFAFSLSSFSTRYAIIKKDTAGAGLKDHRYRLQGRLFPRQQPFSASKTPGIRQGFPVFS